MNDRKFAELLIESAREEMANPMMPTLAPATIRVLDNLQELMEVLQVQPAAVRCAEQYALEQAVEAHYPDQFIKAIKTYRDTIQDAGVPDPGLKACKRIIEDAFEAKTARRHNIPAMADETVRRLFDSNKDDHGFSACVANLRSNLAGLLPVPAERQIKHAFERQGLRVPNRKF